MVGLQWSLAALRLVCRHLLLTSEFIGVLFALLLLYSKRAEEYTIVLQRLTVRHRRRTSSGSGRSGGRGEQPLQETRRRVILCHLHRSGVITLDFKSSISWQINVWLLACMSSWAVRVYFYLHFFKVVALSNSVLFYLYDEVASWLKVHNSCKVHLRWLRVVQLQRHDF